MVALLGLGAQLGGTFGLSPIFWISRVRLKCCQEPGGLLDFVLVIDPDTPAVRLLVIEMALDLLDVEVVGEGAGGLFIRQVADQSHIALWLGETEG